MEDDAVFQSSDPVGSSTISVYAPSVSRARASAAEWTATSPTTHTDPAMIARHAPAADDERAPLLSGDLRRPKKKWYRARPLWLVPFSVTASIARGMTLGSRVEVFTQLSCNAIYGHDVYDHTSLNNTLLVMHPKHFLFHVDPTGSYLHGPQLDLTGSTHEVPVTFTTQDTPDNGDDDDEPDPRMIPSKRCLQDAAVQAGAARLQTTMTFTMGVLSALTTGWWGHFGELHGRTRVLAAATTGLFLTDLIFILVSTPHSIFAVHGHKLLILAPMMEGLLGGWQTVQAAINAYVSDCTSDGSRAQIFSRFTGASFLGLSVGPAIGAFLIRHPLFTSPATSVHGSGQSVTSVFYVSTACSFLNVLLAVFVFPEPPKRKGKAVQEEPAIADASASATVTEGKHGFLAGFLGPFALMAPRTVETPDGRTRKDWRLTWLALALLVYALSTGIFQIKYLYAEHIYGWGAEQLSYYISAMGAARTLYLLMLMPVIILMFKPTPPSSSAAPVPLIPVKKPPRSPAQIAAEMKFDLSLLRASLCVDLLSHVLVSLSPPESSAAAFTAFTALSSFGAGVDPALQSLALCVMQMNGEDNRGKLFGLFAMLRTIGQMIIGPLLFGVVYSATVAQFPKAIFVAAGSFAFVAFLFLCMVRPDAGPKTKRRPRRLDDIEIERGRSRISKDISKSGSQVTVVPVSESLSGSLPSPR